jgi:hypothetical protein
VTTPAPPVHSGAHGVHACVCGVLSVTDTFTRKILQFKCVQGGEDTEPEFLNF